MVTALDQQSDRVAGIEAGADDFLTKPVNDIALMARVKSLLRLKMMMDEMRMRESTGRSLGIMPSTSEGEDDPSAGGRILVIEEREITARRIVETLGDNCEVELDREYDSAVEKSRTGDFDLIIVSLTVEAFDGLRFCSQIRSMETTRHVPILVLVEEDDLPRLVRALDLGVNDYLMLRRPTAHQFPYEFGNGSDRPSHGSSQPPLHDGPLGHVATKCRNRQQASRLAYRRYRPFQSGQ
jgi:two-component system cell cycle response regulator